MYASSNRERLSYLAVYAALVFLLAITFGIIPPARGETGLKIIRVDLTKLYATDGDTVRYEDENYRLMGFDTPETFRSRCEYELKLGLQAKEHLLKLIREAKEVHLERRGLDKYQRWLAVLLLDGEDVAPKMIQAGLAVEYHGRTKRIDWCARQNRPN